MMMRRASLVLLLLTIGATASAFTPAGSGIRAHRGGFSTGRPTGPATRFAPALGARVTRPAPPLVRSFPRHHHHFHGDRPIIVFESPGFYGSRSFGGAYSGYGWGWPYSFAYPYPYRPLYPFGAYYESPVVDAAPATIDAPYYCWVDGLGFTDEAAFADHLHDAHGVPRLGALAHAESVGGRLVYFGR